MIRFDLNSGPIYPNKCAEQLTEPGKSMKRTSHLGSDVLRKFAHTFRLCHKERHRRHA